VATFKQRLQIAARVFQRGLPGRPWHNQSKKVAASILAWPSFRLGQPQWKIIDEQTYIDEGFNLNSLVYTAIMWKVRASIIAPLHAYGEDGKLLKPTHPLSRLIARPSPHQSWLEFQSINTVFLNISGNSYIWLNRDRRGVGLPTEMRPLRPDRVFIVPKPERDGLLGYLYVPEGMAIRDGRPIFPEDLIHIKLPNPGDPLEGLGYGMSPLGPGAQSTDVDNMTTGFLKMFFERGALPPGVLSFDLPLTDEQATRIKERWSEVYGGYENWTEVGVLGKGGSYERVGLTFEEMGFEGLDRRTGSRILGPFGIPALLLGTAWGLENSTLNNYETARQAAWEDTMIPELALFMADYNHYLCKDTGTYLGLDLTKIPALRQAIPNLVDAVRKLWLTGMPLNQAIRTVGLEADDVVGGDTGYIPVSVYAIGTPHPKAQGEGEGEGRDTDVESDPEIGEEADGSKARIGDNASKSEPAATEKKTRALAEAGLAALDSAKRWETRYVAAAKTQFESDFRDLSAILSETEQEALQDGSTIDWGRAQERCLTSLEGKTELWVALFVPLLRGIIEEQHKRWQPLLGGDELDMYSVFMEQWFQQYSMPFAQQVVGITQGHINELFLQGIQESWSAAQFQKNLGLLFQKYIDADLPPSALEWFAGRVPAYRLETIARSEVMRAFNRTSLRLFEAWGIEFVEWYTTKDDLTCDFCLEMDGKIVRAGDKFWAMGETMFVSDAEGQIQSIVLGYEDVLSPPLHPRCRCILLPVLKEIIKSLLRKLIRGA
jgi:HK97 family phage portal protein